MTDLSPASLNKLAERFATEPKLFEAYFENYVKHGDPRLEFGCDKKCYENLLCKMVTTEFRDQSKCNELLALFKRQKINKL